MLPFASLPLLVAASLLLLGCPEPANDTPPPDRNNVAVCLEGSPFVASGDVPLEDAGAGDADTIAGLRWEAHDGCERFVIDLASGDQRAATSPGEASAEVLRDLGVVRISLRDVGSVQPDATDAQFDGPLADAAYAVWSPDGRWTFVDLHLRDAAEAHVHLLRDPARVVVDLRPGGPRLREAPVTHQRVVVLEPRPGVAGYPLEVTGYARTFEANVVVRIEQNGEEVFEDFTTATAWVDAWGHFSLTIPEGPSGDVVLHVGEHSARDGTWEGAAIELTLR